MWRKRNSRLELFCDGAELALLLNQLGYQTGPPGLMRCAESSSGIAMEVLVEQMVRRIVTRSGRRGGAIGISFERPQAITVFHPQFDETIGKLVRNLLQRQITTRPGRTFHLEVVSIIMVKLLKRL